MFSTIEVSHPKKKQFCCNARKGVWILQKLRRKKCSRDCLKKLFVGKILCKNLQWKLIRLVLLVQLEANLYAFIQSGLNSCRFHNWHSTLCDFYQDWNISEIRAFRKQVCYLFTFHESRKEISIICFIRYSFCRNWNTSDWGYEATESWVLHLYVVGGHKFRERE